MAAGLLLFCSNSRARAKAGDIRAPCMVSTAYPCGYVLCASLAAENGLLLGDSDAAGMRRHTPSPSTSLAKVALLPARNLGSASDTSVAVRRRRNSASCKCYVSSCVLRMLLP